MISVAVLAAGCAPKAGWPHLDKGANELMTNLRSASEEGRFLYFHQDDLVYGHSWKVEDTDNDHLDRSDVKSVCGQFPAGVGFDLGGIELGNEANLDNVPFSLMRRAAVTQYERGGAVTFSWHPRNPQTGGDAWDVSSDQAVAGVLEGGANHETFMKWLSNAADFLGSLKDSKGELIPVIFRPWHENLGNWFWWGSSCCTDGQYKELYAMTREYLAGTRGLKNLVWAYSPNSNLTEESFYSRYPGDENVDIIGVDHYDYAASDSTKTEAEIIADANAFYAKVLRSDMELLSGIAAGHGKLLAFCETGFESTPDPRWWTDVLLENLKGAPICYVLTWRNAWDKPEHYFAPFEGTADADNFKEFCGSDRTIFLK